jgi:hypothetical protein
MQLIIEKISSQNILIFREITKNLTKYNVSGGFIWKDGAGERVFYQRINDLKRGIIRVDFRFYMILKMKMNISNNDLKEFIKEKLWINNRINAEEIYLTPIPLMHNIIN